MKEEVLVQRIKEWGFDRKITVNGKPATQANKTMEEALELLEAYLECDTDKFKDAIGDVAVTLIMQLELQGLEYPWLPAYPAGATLDTIYHVLIETNKLQKQINLGEPVVPTIENIFRLLKSFSHNFEECLELAYNEIKDRKGYLDEAGDFIKEVSYKCPNCSTSGKPIRKLILGGYETFCVSCNYSSEDTLDFINKEVS